MAVSESTIFVISDLHLGGRPHPRSQSDGPPGSRINSSYLQLTQFIDWLAVEGTHQGKLELVINGDIVDFLLADEVSPDPSPWTSDEDEIVKRLDAIVENSRETGGRGPFDALADFCGMAADGKVTLVLLLGNHDLELSLPKVRQHFIKKVLRSDGRGVRFVYDNECYCRGDLLIEHGNRYDSLNAVNHDSLRRVRSAMSREEDHSCRSGGKFTPPGGSVLVTELFNPLKKIYRFLDLLKPEREAVLPLMLALEPRATEMISAIVTYSKVSLCSTPSSVVGGEIDPGYIAADQDIGTSLDLSTLLRDALGSEADVFDVSAGGQIGAADAWKAIKEMKRRSREWVIGVDHGILAGRNRKQLSVALRKLAKDSTFSLHLEVDPYLSEAKRLASSGRFSTIVFGHTHLPKQIHIERSGLPPAQYLNTGTWADVMLVPPEVKGSGPDAEKEIDLFLERLASNQLNTVRYLSYAKIHLLEEGGEEKVQSAEIHSYLSLRQPDGDPLMEAGDE